MVKHSQTIRRLLPMNCLSAFDHFVGLVLKGLKRELEQVVKYAPKSTVKILEQCQKLA